MNKERQKEAIKARFTPAFKELRQGQSDIRDAVQRSTNKLRCSVAELKCASGSAGRGRTVTDKNSATS